jgi:hypothetical protein
MQWMHWKYGITCNVDIKNFIKFFGAFLFQGIPPVYKMLRGYYSSG